MPEAASYAAVEVLRDGTRAEIRALRPDDRAAILAAVDHTSERSLYRRFFAAKRSFSEREIAFFLNIAGSRHRAAAPSGRDRRWRGPSRVRRGGSAGQHTDAGGV